MRTQDVNLRHFFALRDIADSGAIRIAADRVFMSQPALTQALRKLDDMAGTSLFARSGLGVTATPAGELLIRRAKRAIALMVDVERDIRTKYSAGSASSPLYRHLTASQLRALVAVAETGGYSTAARRLGVAQPTVHRAAKELEKTVGIDLFQPAARGVEPSEAAIQLARSAQLVFVEVRQGFEEVKELQGATESRIAVGCLPLARSELLPTAVTRLLSTYPDAQISILDGPYVEQLHALRNGHIDWLIGALRNPAPTKDVVQEHLFYQPLAIVVRPGHPLLDRAPTDIAAMASLEWVAPRRLAPAREFFDAFFESNNIDPPTRVIECSSLVATRGILRQSDRAALLSPLQVREDVAAGELAILVDAIPGSSRSIGLTMRHSWEPTMVQIEFVKILRSLASQIDAPQDF